MFLKPMLFSASILALSSICADSTVVDLHPHKMNFSLSQFGYEYNKTDSLYTSADFKVTPLWNTKNKTFDNFDYWSNFELKLGYNFGVAGEHHLIPYAMMGYSSFNMNDYYFQLKEYSYIGLGLKSMFTFGPIFEMGLHLKTHRSLVMMYSIQGHRVGAENNKWKLEIGVPCIWHLGDTKQWDISVEPYYTQLPTLNRGDYLGSRIAFGYRF